MIELTLPGKYNTIIECCEKYISPRRYYLHNKVGGNGWEVSHSSDLSNGFSATLKVDNELMSTFIMLKLK
jgi:hypothetical protein